MKSDETVCKDNKTRSRKVDLTEEARQSAATKKIVICDFIHERVS